MHDMVTALCPTCGAARTGSFRFCRSCGWDFDSDEQGSTPTTPGVLGALPDEAPVASASPNAGKSSPPAGDVIVIQKRHLRLWAGLLIGALIGMMLAGAVVVPIFGEANVLFGSIAAVVIVIVSAWLGLRFVQALTRRG
jgi:hypothetical protein